MKNNSSDSSMINEQKRIDRILQEIGEKIHLFTNEINRVGRDSSQIRKNFWNDVTVNVDDPDDLLETHISIRQQAELLGERERTSSQIKKQLITLNRLKDSPYFGRIDFQEDGEETERIYIGISSLMDKKQEEFYIYDWRAPIASIYYDFAPGKASYQTPEGEINGELQLKRQLLIRNGKLIQQFDTGITIGDELLLEVLGNNASSMMKSIVATIQKEQNKIIRNEESKILIVQGAAGSGKTSAALQRVAYLLYKHRQTLRSDNIILFSPNPLFNSYVSTVLPELGEDNMEQTTFLEYLSKRIGREYKIEDSFSQLEFLLTTTEDNRKNLRLLSIKYKGSLSFKQKLDQYIEMLIFKGICFRDIKFKKKVLITKEELSRHFYELDEHINIPNRMVLLQQWAQKELRLHAKSERNQSWVDEELQYLDREAFLEAYKQAQRKKGKDNEFTSYQMEELILRKGIINKHFKKLFKKVKNNQFVDYQRIYGAFFKESISEEFTAEEWNKLANETVVCIQKKTLWNEDATPFAYLKDKLEGKGSNSRIRQVFVDEAQDYSDFQMEYLKELFPSSRMTLLGDINQAIYAHEHNALIEENREKEVERIELTKSYRSTREIVEFAKVLVKNGDKIEPFNRHGEKPMLINVKDQKRKMESLLENIHYFHQKGYKTIAIIGRTAMESVKIYKELKKEMEVKLIEKGTLAYEKGISVIPAYLAKGIEFDAVILYDGSDYASTLERELFYTACTRAMHELYIYLDDNKKNPFIQRIDQGMYRQQILK